MKARAADVLAGGVLIALVIPWAATILLWLGTPPLLPSNLFEFAVFCFVLGRALLYLGSPALRKLSWGASIILFSGDMLIFPAAALLSFATGNSLEVAFASSYTASWLSASLLVYPPVAAYAIIEAIREKARLTFVLPAAACCFTISTLVMIAVESTAGSHGLNGILIEAIVGVKHPVLPAGWALEVITFCGAILFVCLAVHALTGGGNMERRLAPQLSLGVAGALGLYVWIPALPRLGPLLALGVPTIVIVSAMWVVSRGS